MLAVNQCREYCGKTRWFQTCSYWLEWPKGISCHLLENIRCIWVYGSAHELFVYARHALAGKRVSSEQVGAVTNEDN